MPVETPVRGLRRIELRTTNPVASAEFYARLLGWVILPADDGTVSCWVGERLAALLRQPAAGERTGWHAVFGGHPPNPQPLADAAGATATLGQGRVTHGPWAPPPRDGEPCWIELITVSDTDEYWTQALRWTMWAPPTAVQPPPFALYGTPGPMNRVVAGRLRLDQHTANRTGTGWRCYLATADLASAVRRVPTLGGAVLVEPCDVPTGVITTLTDPAGAVCTLLHAPTGWGGNCSVR